MIVGPIIAVLSFVCSVGNVPLAAVLWSGGISFAGVLAFLFADLIVLPIIVVYRKYYGLQYTARIVALMFITMIAAGLIVNGLFSALGILPAGPRPSRSNIFGAVHVDYKLFLNLLGIAIFAALFWLTITARRHRPRLRDEGRPRQSGHQTIRRTDVLLLLRSLPARVRDRPHPIQRGRQPAVSEPERHVTAP